MPAPNDRVGDYTLRSPLGTGGFGSVWLADAASANRQVALKILHEELVDYRVGEKGPTVAERFLAEARILQNLSHPGLVRIYDVIELPERKIVAYAMERLIGSDLANCAADLDLSTLLELFAKTAETLGFLHDNGVIHRDVKAPNIFITDPPAGQRGPYRVKLLDFGVAKEVHAEAMLANTATGMFMGSVGSMPPESFRRWDDAANTLTSAMDQWSLAATLYQCLSGRMPFVDPGMVGLISKIESEPHEPLTMLDRFELTATPVELTAIVARCLQKNPNRRYASMKELARGLRQAAEEICGGNKTLFDVEGDISMTLIDGDERPQFDLTAAGATLMEPGIPDSRLPTEAGHRMALSRDTTRRDDAPPAALNEPTVRPIPHVRKKPIREVVTSSPPLVRPVMDTEDVEAPRFDAPDSMLENVRIRAPGEIADTRKVADGIGDRTVAANSVIRPNGVVVPTSILAVGFILTLIMGVLIGWIARGA